MSSNEHNVEDLVCEALLMTNAISQAVIQVEHHEGVITLKGTVESEKDKLAVEALARQQEGIVEVINKLGILDR